MESVFHQKLDLFVGAVLWLQGCRSCLGCAIWLSGQTRLEEALTGAEEMSLGEGLR